MAVTSAVSRIAYTLTGSGQTLAVPFVFNDATDVGVVSTPSAGGNDVPLVLNTDYTVTGGGATPAFGSITLVGGATGDVITIYRNSDLTQEAEYTPNDRFPAKTTETALDRNTMYVQQCLLLARRAVRFPISNPEAAELTVAARKNKILGFDGVGGVSLQDPVGAPALAGSVIECTSYSALRAVLVAGFVTGRQASTLGYSSGPDGGEGLWKYDSASSATDNNGTVLAPNVGVGRWLRLFSGPVNVKWFGAKGDGSTDDYVAIAAATALAQATSATVFFPATASGYLCNTGIVATLPIKWAGEPGSFILTTADITVLHLSVAATSTSQIDSLQIVGPGTGTSTKPGIKLTNSNQNTFRLVRVRGFDTGIYFAAGAIAPESCYLNSCYACRFEANKTYNIYGEKNTNALLLSGCVVGGGPCATGVKLVDSNTLTVIGGDAEGLSLTVFDLDATSTINAAHTICGFHFEGNTSSAGDVRIGLTAAVNGVTLLGNIYSPGSGNDSAVSAINGNGLVIHGGSINGGYTGVIFQRIAATFGASWSRVGLAGIYDEIPTIFKTYDQGSFPYLGPTSYSANYTTASFGRYNQLRIRTGDLTAGKYFAPGLDIARLDNSGSAGAGARVYARIFQVSDGAGGGFMRAATLHDGGIDVINGSAALGQSAAADTLGNGAVIETTDAGIPTVVRVSPGAAYTGIILQAGFRSGQLCIVINEAAAANTVTFAVAGTSNVADGATTIIAGLRSAVFAWDTATNLWYRS